jgi:NADH-quinone oxidoreductase subunit M
VVAALLAAILVPLVAGAALVTADNAGRVGGSHNAGRVGGNEVTRRIETTGVGQRTAAAIALAAAAVTAACVGIAVVDRPELDRPWVPAIGLRLHLGVDGISAPLLVLTAGVGLLAVLHGIARPPATTETPTGERHGTFLGCLLLVIGAAVATFLARDAVLFFLAFELVLIPMWLLIKGFGDPATRGEAASRFVLYTVLGSTLMLVGILAMTFAVGSSDLETLAAAAPTTLNTAQQTLIAALLLIGLGIKVPVFPLHSWLPAAHTSAPTAGSMLLAAVLLKMGTYGVIRLVAGPVPDGLGRLAPVVGVIAVVGILWGGLVCLVETSLKRLIAWSSVAHMGFVMLAIASGTPAGVQAALYGNLAHGVVSALLFAVVGGLKDRWGDDSLATARAALRDASPKLGLALVVGMAGSLALPGLAAFWGEVLAVFAAWTPGAGRPGALFRVLAVLAALGGVLASAYALRVLRVAWAEGGAAAAGRVGEPSSTAGRVGEPPGASRIETSEVDRGLDSASASAPAYSTTGESASAYSTGVEGDAHGPEWVVIGILILAVIGLGLAPPVILPISEADVLQLLGVGR